MRSEDVDRIVERLDRIADAIERGPMVLVVPSNIRGESLVQMGAELRRAWGRGQDDDASEVGA